MANNAELIKQCEERAQQWLAPAFDEETRNEVKAMLEAEDKSALVDAFYQNLEFGTGGLRGIMGAGTNRMNKYIVGMATQGFANYILKAFPGEKNLSVVVGHDCRNNSRLFAETVAAIFSANGIKAYLFESLRPTPEISFAIRELGAKAGVNVTASHNPKEYNGYKAYWSDGAQVLAPHDTGIIEEVNKVTIDQVKFEANWDLIKIIGGEMDYDYMTAVHSAMIDQDVINRQKDLNIVYSAMHGTGRVIVPLCLRSWGFQNINVVPEQMVVDGNFPTVVSPNPENAEAMTHTGFKWIAREIAISEGKQQYIGGGEESFGFLPYDKVRDKDAPASICLICEIAAWAKDQGKTLYDLLMQIYAEYGFSKEFTVNVVRPGKTGADEIKQMMADFRANPPKELGGSKIVTWKDYQSLEAKHVDGSVEKLNMPTTSNVLQWFCDDNTKVSVRPSGTEPKIKFYIEVKDPSFKCAGCYNRCTAAAMEKIEAIKKSLNLD